MIHFIKALDINMSCLGTKFELRVEQDNKHGGRFFLQVFYNSPCSKTGEVKEWRGRKWYLSEHMLEDEIVKTVYSAFKACVEHEIMEGFKIGDTVLFNPHTNYKHLLKVSNFEVQRKQF